MVECPVLPINCAYASVFVCPPLEVPAHMALWDTMSLTCLPTPHILPCGWSICWGCCRNFSLLPRIQGIGNAMLVARQQPLAHHCNFRGWQGWISLPFPLEFGVSSFHFLFLYHIYVVPWIPVGSQHLLAFWSSGVQHSRSCATLPCLPTLFFHQY